jgi:hypothetical protein
LLVKKNKNKNKKRGELDPPEKLELEDKRDLKLAEGLEEERRLRSRANEMIL